MRFLILVIGFIFIGYFNVQFFEFWWDLDVLIFYYGEQFCFVYQIGILVYVDVYLWFNYFYLVYGLGGVLFIQDFLEDYCYYWGVFWIWYQFFVGEVWVGDFWLCEGICWEVKVLEIQACCKWVSIEVIVYWMVGLDVLQGVLDMLVWEDVCIYIW